MRTSEDELLSILDEMVAAAVSMQSGAQNYDSFIKARSRCMIKIQETFNHNQKVSYAIQELAKLVNY